MPSEKNRERFLRKLKELGGRAGNTFDKDGQSTCCHECGERLIGRDWYELSEWNLTDDGHCLKCGAQCAGVFAGRPGHWGRKRRPVWMAAESAR